MGIWQTIVNFISTMKFATIVRSYEGGVRFRCGRIHKKLGPGLHWQWPFIDATETIDVVPQVVDLPNQSIVTEDNKTLAVSGVLKYRIKDATLALTEVQDLDTSIQTLVMYSIHNRLSSCTAEEAKDADALEEAVIAQTRLTFKEWGVSVDRVGLTDGPSPHKLIRLLGDLGGVTSD